MTLKPNELELHHWDEWLSSGVDLSIVSLNVTSLSGDLIYDYLCYSPQLERTNTGRLKRGIIQRYEHAKADGWWCRGIDLLMWKPMLWGCFKPDFPCTNNFDKLGKTIKYEHPLKTPTRVLLLQVPDEIWEKVSQRYSKPLTAFGV